MSGADEDEDGPTYLDLRVVGGDAVADESVRRPETVEYVNSERRRGRISAGHARQQARGDVERGRPTADDGELDRSGHHSRLGQMQATLSAAALKRTSPTRLFHTYALISTTQQAFIRALTCLSRYGDDLVLHADAQHVTLSATNSSLSAYCRFRYGRMYFSRYRVGGGVNGAGPSNGSPSAPQDVKGQLLVKVRLACFWIRVCMH